VPVSPSAVLLSLAFRPIYVHVHSGEPPSIDPCFFTDPEGCDLEAMLSGIRTVRQLAGAEPLSSRVKGGNSDLLPGPFFSQSLWGPSTGGGGKDKGKGETIHALANTNTYYHPHGTCAVGACLDARLQVRGVRQLRVADASALPPQRGPIAAACMVVGARCADFILADKKQSGL
jgi:choline dehydrogenase-like flavoprotein